MPRRSQPRRRPGSAKREARAWVLLLLLEDPAHGWDLVNRMKEFGIYTDAGTLYPTLRALEADGCVESNWEPPTRGPERRVYTITSQGRRELEQHVKELADRRRALNRFIKHHRELTS